MLRLPLLAISLLIFSTICFIVLKLRFNLALEAIASAALDSFKKQSNFERMRKLYAEQAVERKNQIKFYSDGTYGMLYNVLVPEVFCSELTRIGFVGDGGKWLCNIFNMPKNENCAIFSLGINNEMSFDIAFQKETNQQCKLYGFDIYQQNDNVVKRFEEINGIVKAANLGNISNPSQNAYTLEDILKMYNLERVEVLKIDIEGSEFAVMPSVFQIKKICQILIEIHGKPAQVIELLRLFASNGYYLFSYEINGYHHDLCEYSFIHESCLETYEVQVLARYLA